MPQGKQAKALSEAQVRTSLSHLVGTRNPERDTVIFMLSIKAGLRAKEIALLRWSMITDPEGHVADAIELQDVASKGNGGRTIPLHKDLRAALVRLKDHAEARRAAIGHTLDLSANVITSERGERLSPNSLAHWFKRLYASLGFDGCSSQWRPRRHGLHRLGGAAAVRPRARSRCRSGRFPPATALLDRLPPMNGSLL